MGVYHITYAPERGEIYLYFDAECNFSCGGCIARSHPIDCHLMGKQLPVRGSLSPEDVLPLLKLYPFKRVFFMGSEPTVDTSFVPLALRLKKEFLSYNILLTNGYEFVETGIIDEVCVSIKAVTKVIFKDFTGKDYPKRVLNNFAKYYSASYLKLRAESVLIPGYIDQKEIAKIAKFISSIDDEIPYRIDAYMPFGRKDKFGRPSIEEMKEAKRVAERYLKNVSILHYGCKIKYGVERVY